MIKLSIVIVSYNTKSLLDDLLGNLSKTKYPFDSEIIVIDNNSEDSSVEMIRKNFSDIHLVCNDKNAGFAGACNQGIKCARGEYILFLNPDTKIIGDSLNKMILFLDTHPEAGVVTGRLVYPDMTDQGVARTFPRPMNAVFGRHSILTRFFPDNKYSRTYLASRQNKSANSFEVDWVSGACLLARKQALEDAGYFDENFFMYWEDADLCYRIKEKGWKVFCVADAIIIHYEGKSTGKKTARLIVEFHKSAYYYYRKNYIKKSFGLKNMFAIFGLTARTLILLAANSFRANNFRKEKGVGIYEKT